MTLHIKEQGVYTAGGIVQKAEGVFDPIHSQLADAGQVRYSDHCTVFYQLPEDGNGKNSCIMKSQEENNITRTYRRKVLWQKNRQQAEIISASSLPNSRS